MYTYNTETKLKNLPSNFFSELEHLGQLPDNLVLKGNYEFKLLRECILVLVPQPSDVRNELLVPVKAVSWLDSLQRQA
jgi:hypothetical protein